jgi:hypothetical protein
MCQVAIFCGATGPLPCMRILLARLRRILGSAMTSRAMTHSSAGYVQSYWFLYN